MLQEVSKQHRQKVSNAVLDDQAVDTVGWGIDRLRLVPSEAPTKFQEAERVGRPSLRRSKCSPWLDMF